MKQIYTAFFVVTIVLASCADEPKISSPGFVVIPQSGGEVAAICSQLNSHQQSVQHIIFPKPDSTCDWGNNDNVPYDSSTQFNQYQDIITARREQTVSLLLPDNSLICGTSFDFDSQQMIFDDEIMLTFDDVLLASSFDYSDRLPSQDGFVLWDWTLMKLTKYQQSDGMHPYCLGSAGGQGSCSIPHTEKEGQMTLGYDSSLVHALSAKAIAEKRYDFSFITTGDNDVGTDCSHSDFQMTVAVDYIQLGN